MTRRRRGETETWWVEVGDLFIERGQQQIYGLWLGRGELVHWAQPRLVYGIPRNGRPSDGNDKRAKQLITIGDEHKDYTKTMTKGSIMRHWPIVSERVNGVLLSWMSQAPALSAVTALSSGPAARV